MSWENEDNNTCTSSNFRYHNHFLAVKYQWWVMCMINEQLKVLEILEQKENGYCKITRGRSKEIW